MHPRLTATVWIAVIGISGALWQAVPTTQHGWQVTELDAGLSESPDVAVDSAGNALAVWVNKPSGDRTSAGRVRAATFTAVTGSWSPAVTLSNPLDHGSNLQVAANANGDAVAVWRADRSPLPLEDYIVVSRYSAATKTWQLLREIPGNGHSTRVVIDGPGNITVVWAEFLRVTSGYYYYYEVYEIRTIRYDTATASWSAPIALSGEDAAQPQVGIDGGGNVTVLWNRNLTVESSRWSSATNTWSAVAVVSTGQTYSPHMVVDAEGNVIAVWALANEGLRGARLSAQTGVWSPPVVVAVDSESGGDLSGSLGVDAAGNATLVYTQRFVSGRAAMLRSIQYLRSADTWGGAVDIAPRPFSGNGQIAVDPAGNATVAWLGPDTTLQTARRAAGGDWGLGASVGGLPSGPRIASDAIGNVFLLWSQRAPTHALQGARWSAMLGAPTLGRVVSSPGKLQIEFTPLRVLEPSYEVLNYEYSLDNGVTWTVRSPASAMSPIVVAGLTDGLAYQVRLRAVNVAGPGLASDAFVLTPGLAPPANLRVAQLLGNSVTFMWTPPSSGVPPTGYQLEGGVNPGSVAARLPSPGTSTIYTLTAPSGSFYVRVRGTLGHVESESSAEIQFSVGVAGRPSPPSNLLGLADGDVLALAWQNTMGGGAPSNIVLEVTGDHSASIPLPPTEHFVYSGVPQGTYAFSLRAVNAFGSSDSSNVVTLTFPGTCSPPATPTSFAVSKSGSTIVLLWSPPASGTAPTSYLLNVTGAIDGTFPVVGLTLSGSVAPGTYTINVAAKNSCGSSAPTPAKTVTIP